MDSMHSTLSMYYDYDAHVKGELLVIMKNSQSVNLLIFISNTLIELFNDFGSDRDGILKRPTMFLNLWRYKVVRHRYSNPMIQPEPEGSTQGYPLVSVEVLRFNTTAGNPVKKILLKLNLSDHRILKDGGGAKRGRATKIPQSGGPTEKVGDEAVHKELGDRMERAATTASSLEAEQDSVLANCFCKHSENGEIEITVTVDERVKNVTEASIRRHLKLEDSDGISTLPNTEIFEQLALMGQETKVPQLSSTPYTNVADEAAPTCIDGRHGGAATAVTSLDARQGSGNINKTPSMPLDSPLPRGHTLGSDEGIMQQNELMDLVTKLSDKCAALEINLRQTKKVYGVAFTRLIKKVKKLEKTVKTSQARRRSRVVIYDDNEELEDPSKQGRSMIEEIDQDTRITLLEKRKEVVNVQSYTRRKRAVSTGSGEISTAEEPVSTAGASMPFSTASIVQEASTPLSIATKDTGKAIMQESESPKKLKQRKQIQISRDKEVALKLQEEFDAAERQRIARVFLDHEGSKKQKTNEASGSVQEQPEEEETELPQEYLQHMMMVVPVEEVYVEALQVKYQIIDWEVYSEDTTSLVKERFSSTNPTDDKERTLWVKFKRLLEPDTDDILWKLQRYMHDPLTWRLYDTCSVHHVSTDRGHDIFMLVEKDYPLTRGLLTLMLCNKLQVDQYSEVADELLRKIVILANRPRQ
ncbi:hypothetical protein Tco_1165583 [Tanacetum coccineum]